MLIKQAQCACLLTWLTEYVCVSGQIVVVMRKKETERLDCPTRGPGGGEQRGYAALDHVKVRILQTITIILYLF